MRPTQAKVETKPKLNAGAVLKYLDLSTCHITEDDRKYLEAKAEDKNNYVELNDSIGFRVVGHEYGWWISVPGLKDWEETEEQFTAAVKEEGLSEAFAKMILHAIKLDCCWINLDQDGDVIEELETFEW